jgi:hypothetical protein
LVDLLEFAIYLALDKVTDLLLVGRALLWVFPVHLLHVFREALHLVGGDLSTLLGEEVVHFCVERKSG